VRNNNNNNNNNAITNLPSPVNNSDAVNKVYIDTKINTTGLLNNSQVILVTEMELL